MSSFEWMELQTLTSEITAQRSRLVAARAKKDHRLTRVLEEEIAAAEERRMRLLSHITNDLADAAEGQRPAAAIADAPPQPEAAVAEPIAVKPAAPAVAEEAETATGEGGWDRLTPGDIVHAKEAVGRRRAAMLARHAEELAALDADRERVEALAVAIDDFLQKFNAGSSRGAIVQLEEEREMRLQSRA